MTSNVSPYFDRDGLLVADLTADVMRWVDCGYNKTTSQMFAYTDGVWRQGETAVEKHVAFLLGNRYRMAHSKTVLELIRLSDDTVAIDCSPQSRNINVPNGMLDWQSDLVESHSPLSRSTVQIPVEYHPEALCPSIDKFFDQVLPPDCIEFIWEVIGYALYAGNPLHVAVLLCGKGRNGKGTFIRLLKALLGEENCSAVGLHDLTENRFRAATLYGKLANLAGDLEARWITNTAVFKAVTGGDTIQAEHKFGAAFDFTPWALPIYSTNKIFGSSDSSEGWFERWLIVPFPNMFTEVDGSQHKRPQNELDGELHQKSELQGMLAHGVRSLRTLMARGHFLQPASIAEAKAQFIAKANPVRSWVTEHYTHGSAEAWTSRSVLYSAYEQSALVDEDVKLLSAQRFYERIEEISGVTPHKRNGQRGFKGIALQPDRPADRKAEPKTAPRPRVQTARSEW